MPLLRLVLFFLLFALAFPSTIAAAPGEVSSWHALPHIEKGSEAWFCTWHRTSGTWSVRAESGHLVVFAYNPSILREELRLRNPIEWDDGPGSNTVLPAFMPTPAKLGLNNPVLVRAYEVSDGWLVALDAGAMGGGIWWYSPEGDEHRLIAEGNPAGFLKRSDEFVLLAGFNHDVITMGSVGFIGRNSSGVWVLKQRLAMPVAIDAYTEFDGRVLMATVEGPFELVGNKVVQLAESNLPDITNSVAADSSGNLYFGMGHMVVKYSSIYGSGPLTETWLVPPSCPSTRIDENGACVCQDGPYEAWQLVAEEETEARSVVLIVGIAAGFLSVFGLALARWLKGARSQNRQQGR